MSGNLYADLPAASAAEQVDTLLARPGARIERIVSAGQASPEGFWYDQAEDEFVLLLRGAARLRFETSAETRDLRPGDWLLIPAGARHRVDWTTPEETTVWLTLFLPAAPIQ